MTIYGVHSVHLNQLYTQTVINSFKKGQILTNKKV